MSADKRPTVAVGMRIYNLALVEAVDLSIEQCANRLFSRQLPKILYHYTGIDGAKGIIRSNSLWGTCLADQRKDANELRDAIQLIGDEVKTLSSKELPPLSKEIFGCVSELLDSRRHISFISCFCDDGDSQHHWHEYGDYRFGILSGQLLDLRCRDLRAHHWLQPVIYDREILRSSIRECFEQIVEAQAKYITGHYGGPLMTGMARQAARDIAQLLIRIATSVKNDRFADDREWRLFFCPNLAIASTAPAMADDDFRVCIRTDKIKHIELRVRQPFEFFVPQRLSGPLFASLFQSPIHTEKAERETLNELLGDASAGIVCERTI